MKLYGQKTKCMVGPDLEIFSQVNNALLSNGLPLLKLSEFLNDHIAKICSMYPNKCLGLGTIPMQDLENHLWKWIVE